MKDLHARRLSLALLVLAGLPLWIFGVQRSTNAAPEEPALRAVNYLPTGTRVRTQVPGHVLVYNPRAESVAHLESITVSQGDRVLWAEGLDRAVPGDPRFRDLAVAIERLPEELNHQTRERSFADPDAPTFGPSEAADKFLEIQRGVAALRERLAGGVTPSFVELEYTVDWAAVFAADDAPGTRRDVVVDVAWRDALGNPSVVSTRTSVELLAAQPRPTELPGLGSISIHGGDLHVHSCKGEAAGACAPFENCAAETLQLSGSFDYATLKAQYISLGYDWFAATDHSYCVDEDSEYQLIVDETTALTDANFIMFPHLELSSDEAGNQVGSDVGDLACLGTTSSNHMGAHGIQSRIEGGESSFQGFCDGLFGSDALSSFTSNIATVRAQGGWPIINHATGSFGWNSFDSTFGIEANAANGCEIWNGATSTGQGADVGRWVDWLLGGRLLYAYSGSDTHDEAFAFGANHAVLQGEAFTPANVERALRSGQSYISNQHMLILEAEEHGVSVLMGSLQGVAPGAVAPAPTINVHYDFGTDSSVIQIFVGRAGDAAETLLCQSSSLTGSGTFTCQAAIDPTSRSWVRAYSEGGSNVAYTNPVFWVPTSCDATAFGVGLGGANVGSLTTSAGTSLGGTVPFHLAGFGPNSTVGQVYFAFSPLTPGLSLLGGTLLLTPPVTRLATGTLSAGEVTLPVELPFEPNLAGITLYVQGVAIDPDQLLGVGFTHGLEFELCLPGQ